MDDVFVDPKLLVINIWVTGGGYLRPCLLLVGMCRMNSDGAGLLVNNGYVYFLYCM